MTARDEATDILIKAIADGIGRKLISTGRGMPALTRSDYEQVIDAIPADVLVRLAIERGTLQQVDVGVYNKYETPLYRLVTP